MVQIEAERRDTNGIRQSLVDRYFHVSARGSTLAREIRGGITTFMAMAYILLLNPVILGGTDHLGHRLPHDQLVTATALGAAVTTLAMGLIGKAPLALAAGLGVSAVLSTQVSGAMSWPEAFGMCVIYGAVIVLLVVSGLRQAVMDAIPMPLKHAITMGIGMFICLIGLHNAGFVSAGKGSLLQLGPAGGTNQLAGWPVLLFCLTVLTIFVLQARRVPGAILIGIAAGTVLAIVVNAALGLHGADARETWGDSVPTWPGNPLSLPDFGLFGQVSFGGFASAGVINAIVILFTLVLSGFFDAMGTIIGIGQTAKLADDKGRMPGLSRALAVDGAGGMFGGLAGASGQTVFVESTSGVGEGARTGFASVVTGVLFALMLFLTPIAAMVPGQVAAAALVVVGSMMLAQAAHVDWHDRATAIPVFLAVAVMPFTFSIAAGVGAGIIGYVVIKLGQGRWRDPSWLMYGLAVLFTVYFGLHPIEQWLGLHG